MVNILIWLTCFMHVFSLGQSLSAENVETRIHRRITLQDHSGVQFGLSISSHDSQGAIIVGSPMNEAGSLYLCDYSYRGKKTKRSSCSSIMYRNPEKGFGTSMAKVTFDDEDIIVACSNQYKFRCPNRTIEQRMVGECLSINLKSSKTYKILTPCPTGCPLGIVADIVFLMDASGSVYLENFEKGMRWIASVLEQFRYDIDESRVQIGYILFNSAAYEKNPLRATSFYDLKIEIENNRNYHGGGTRTDFAIEEGMKMLNEARDNVPKVMITVTDGDSNAKEKTEIAADDARKANIIMIAVGIGNGIELSELRYIANGGDTSDERVLTVQNYDELGDVLDELGQVIKESASTSLEGGDSNSTTELTNCQFGTSITTSRNGVFIGAPGSYDRVGTVAQYGLTNFPREQSYEHLKDTNLEEITGYNIKNLKDSYFGYSTTSGNFENDGSFWIISAGPRYLSRGAVLAYKSGQSSNRHLIHPSKEAGYWQLGGYYGQSVLVMDLNKDNYDDLIVSEPLFSDIASYDQGVVFIYMNDRSGRPVSKWASSVSVPNILRGNAASGARFGLSLADVGDIDRNGFNDLIIGAPSEGISKTDTSIGAIYIYFSSANGLDSSKFQRIPAKSLEATKILKGFGWSFATGSDFDDNKYTDVAVSAPLSDSVLQLRSRKVISISLTLSVNPKIINIFSCTENPTTPCATVSACISAQYLHDSPGTETFSLVHNITLDSLNVNSNRRFIFLDTQTSVLTVPDISVGPSGECYRYEIQVNMANLGRVNSGGLDVIPRLKMGADLAPTHKNQIMSGVLSILDKIENTADMSFRTHCSNGLCQHDLQISANFSEAMSEIPIKLDRSTKTLIVNGKIINNGPDPAYFVKVNISSGNLTINRVTSSCVVISDYESEKKLGVTVLRYDRSGNFLKDLMEPGTKCEFTIEFDFTRPQTLARDFEVRIRGKLYSNAGKTVSRELKTENNEFLFHNPVQYRSNLVIGGNSEPPTVLLEFPKGKAVTTVTTLEDSILGGKETNVVHRYNIYNYGPLGLGNSGVKISWPEKSNEGLDLLYLIDVYCIPYCRCDSDGLINKYRIAPNNESRRAYYKKFEIAQPDSSKLIASSDKITCGNSQCNEVLCDLDFVDRFQRVSIYMTFKLWMTSFNTAFVKADIESLIKLIPSNITALPIQTDGSITSALQSYDPENPPPTPQKTPSNIAPIIGGILGGLVLLAVAIALMWKFGFFKSKYGTMVREARNSVRDNNDVAEVEGRANRYSYGSTADLVDD